MMTFSDLASVPSGPPAPFTDQLRLAVAAYPARFKGSSRVHTESDLRCYRFAADSGGVAAHLQDTFGSEWRIKPALLPAFQIPRRLPVPGQVYGLEREHNP